MFEYSLIFILWFGLGICAERFIGLSSIATRVYRLVKKSKNRLMFDDHLWALLLDVVDAYVDRGFEVTKGQGFSANGCPFFGIRFTLKEDYTDQQLLRIQDRVKRKLNEMLKQCGKDWELYADHTIEKDVLTIYIYYVEFNDDKTAYNTEKSLTRQNYKEQHGNSINVHDNELSKDLENIQNGGNKG